MTLLRSAAWVAETIAAVLVAAGLTGCVTTPIPASAPDRSAMGGAPYAYVVLGEEGKAIARVVTSASQCPSIAIDGSTVPMDVRARPATLPLRPTNSSPSESKPSVFGALTCEREIPVGTSRATIDGVALALPKANPRRIVVLGDTGCRMKSSDGLFQACNDPAQWPFAAVADAAADTDPDLVIHVGDYHYRENACPSGNANCAGSPWGYGWDAWEADLFAPAKKLLAAAPWIVVRGNHESCARAGQGWWRFLDPRPLASGRDCNDAADDAIGDYGEPYAVPLGSASTADTQFIVFDSSRVGIRRLATMDPMYATYRAQLERAFALGARRPQTFFMNHHPILAFASNPSRPDAPYPGNAGLQSVLEGLHPTVLFPPNVQALLAGHYHLFEVVSFATPQPAQFVTGNGGDWADAGLLSPMPPGATPYPGAIVANIVATNRFGFMTMERSGAGWTMTARDMRGAIMTTCALARRKATCVPATLP
jgi:hypothetical protein